MTTIQLIYDVIGKNCPSCMVVDNCALRKNLANLEKKYKIGYSMLENGNLVVPKVAMLGEDYEINHFDLDKTLNVCYGCYGESRKKELENTVDKQPETQTVIFAYLVKGTNCPSGMNHKNCQLRKEMTKMETQHGIGYKQFDDKNTLLIPGQYYNPSTNTFCNIRQQCADICSRCFQKNR